MRFWKIEVRISVHDPDLRAINKALDELRETETIQGTGSAGVGDLIELFYRTDATARRWFTKAQELSTANRRLTEELDGFRRAVAQVAVTIDPNGPTPLGDAISRERGMDLDVTARTRQYQEDGSPARSGPEDGYPEIGVDSSRW